MASLRLNIAANYLGQLISTAAVFFVVPFYLHYVGAEGYGIIGFLLSLQAVLAVLDLGLSTTANREIGHGCTRESETPNDLVRTLECVYGITGVLIFAGVALSADYLAHDWVQAGSLSPVIVKKCVLIAGGIICLRWPLALYAGVLRGMEHQVQLNLLSTGFTVLRSLAGVAVLLRAPTVEAYFWSQLFAGALELAAYKVFCHIHMKSLGKPGAFSREILRRVWGFSWRVAAISLCAVLIKQIDRVIISKLLTLKELGYYTTATVVGYGISRAYGPVQVAVFPRFNRLFASQRTGELATVFHWSAALTAFITTPLAAVCLFFARDVLFLWTRDHTVADHAALPLAIYASAMWLNCLMSLPYMLQLAAGLTWLPLRTNLIGAITLVPLTVYLVAHFGLSGGAWAWLVFNVGYFLIVPHFLFRHVLTGEKVRWYVHDCFGFILCGLAAFGGWRLVHIELFAEYSFIPVSLLAGLTYCGLVAVFYPQLRAQLWKRIGILSSHPKTT